MLYENGPIAIRPWYRKLYEISLYPFLFVIIAFMVIVAAIDSRGRWVGEKD